MGASLGLARIGEPADTAGLVVFLASGDAGFTTSQVIYNTGGQHQPISRASRLTRLEPAIPQSTTYLRNRILK
jgi:hypothetical protein